MTMSEPAGATSTAKISPHDEQPGGQLKGRLGVGSIVFTVVSWAAPLLIVVGQMPAIIGFAQEGIVAAFTVVTVIVLLFAVGYAELTRHVERPGAFYAYITAGLGRAAGLGGAFVAVFGYTILVLFVWIAFGVYARQLVTDTLGGPDLPWYLYGIVGAVVAAWFSHRQIDFSAKFLGLAMMLEVVLVLAFNAVVFINGGPTGIPAEPLSPEAMASGNFGLALLFGMLSFIGFESAAIYREEAKNPEKTIPRATYIAVFLIGAFYILASWALLTALGTDGVAHAGEADVTTMFGSLAANYMGAAVPNLINVLVVTSTFACLLTSRNAAARYMYSLGRDGVFPARLGVAHPRRHSPYVASLTIFALEILTVVLIAVGTGFEFVGTNAYTFYIRAAGLGAIAIVFLMCLVAAAVLGYFTKYPAAANGRTWKTKITPVLGLVGLLLILVLGLINVDALIGAGPLVSFLLTLVLPAIFIAGLLYARSLRTKRPHVYAKIGRQ